MSERSAGFERSVDAGRTDAATSWKLAVLLLAALVVLPLLVVIATGKVPLPIDLVARSEPHRAAATELGLEVRSHGISHEIATLLVPQRHLVREAFRCGEWPHWNPSVQGGMPLAAAGQAAPLWPTTLLTLGFPLALGLGLDFLLRLQLAAFGAFLLARDLGMRPLAAVVAGIGYGLGGFTVFWAMWPLGAAMVMMPWVWLAVRRLVRRPGPGEIVVLAAVVAVLLCAGHPQSCVHVLAVGSAVGLAGLVGARGRRWAVVMAAAGAGLLALAMAAVFVLPMLELLPHSTAWAHRGTSVAPSLPFAQVLERLLLAVVPFRHGVAGADAVSQWPSWTVPWAGPAVGGVLLVLAAVGLADRTRTRAGLVVATLVGLLAGARAAPLWDFLEHLPLFNRTINDRLVALALLGLALLAARGAQRLTEEAPLGRGERWVAPASVVGLVGLVLLLLRDELWRPELASDTVVLLATTTITGLLVALGRRGTTVVLVLVVLATAERWWSSRLLIEGRDPRFLALNPPILELTHTTEPSRLVGVGRLLTPNLATLAGLEDLRGYDPVLLARLEGVRSWSVRFPAWYDHVDDLDHPALDRLGVRFAIAPGWIEPPSGWRVVERRGRVRLLENEQALARAFVPREIHVDAEPAIADGTGKRASIAAGVVGPVEGSPLPGIGRLVNPIGRVAVERRRSNHLVLHTDLEGPGWVVVTEPAWPGWRAWMAGGAQLPLTIADGAFLAIEVPGGQQTVELRWRPSTFVAGFLASVLGVAIAVALLGLRVRRRHR